MAAYAYTATVTENKLKLIGGYPGERLVSGTINVTNYNGTTPVAITEITSKFKGSYQVQLTATGTSFVSMIPSWDATNKTIRFTVISAGAFAQLADNAAGITVNFLATGI